MATLDKEIRVIAVRGEKGTDGQDGQDGKSSYELAIENELFSGTLEEWINTFATPENYITRGEFQKVTQAQYDALKQAGELIPNCYYLIIDSTDAEDFEQALGDISDLKDDVSDLKDDVNNQSTGLKVRVGNVEQEIDVIDDDVNNQSTGLKVRVSNVETNKLDKEVSYYDEDEGTTVAKFDNRFGQINLTVTNGSNETRIMIYNGAIVLIRNSEYYDLLSILNRKLYKHDIRMSGTGYNVVFTIYNYSSSKLNTPNKIREYMNKDTGDQSSPHIIAGGYVTDNNNICNIQYVFTSGTGNLTASYTRYNNNNVSWESWYKDISSATIYDGITEI